MDLWEKWMVLREQMIGASGFLELDWIWSEGWFFTDFHHITFIKVFKGHELGGIFSHKGDKNRARQVFYLCKFSFKSLFKRSKNISMTMGPCTRLLMMMGGSHFDTNSLADTARKEREGEQGQKNKRIDQQRHIQREKDWTFELLTKTATEKFGNERKAGLEATEGQSGKDKKEQINEAKNHNLDLQWQRLEFLTDRGLWSRQWLESMASTDEEPLSGHFRIRLGW